MALTSNDAGSTAHWTIHQALDERRLPAQVRRAQAPAAGSKTLADLAARGITPR